MVCIPKQVTFINLLQKLSKFVTFYVITLKEPIIHRGGVCNM